MQVPCSKGPNVVSYSTYIYGHCRSLMVKTKVTSSVIYPETLDLSRYSGCQDDVYKLTSVIIHLGPTAYSGHYIAHIRDTKVSTLKYLHSHVLVCSVF